MTPTGLLTLGRYTLVREIARSNDIVWEGIDPQMNRHVAVKELNLPPNLTGQARRERIERFYREARAAGKLNHPNIVTIHEVGEQAGRYFIAMEFLEGQTLRDRLATVGALSQQEAVQFAAALCDALAYAHEQGIVHRDIKPDNVHIVPGNRVKLTDFGIARITGEQQLTMAGQVFGTPSYMSPEQVIGREIDARSDLFSLGIMLYEMLAGRKPFTGEGDSVVTIAHRIMSEPTPPALGAASALNAVIQRATAKDPNQRFRTAHEMKAALLAADTRTGAFQSPLHATAPPASSYPTPYPTAGGYPAQAPQATQMYGARTQYGAAPPQQPVAPYNVSQTIYPPARNPSGNGARIAAITGILLLVLGGIGYAGSLAFSRAFQQQQAQVKGNAATNELNQAILLYSNKRYEEAAAAFAKISHSSDPTTAANAIQYESFCYVELGNAAALRGDLATAERYFQEALRLDPSSADVQKGLENVRQARARNTTAAPVASAPAQIPPPPTSTAYNKEVSTNTFNQQNQNMERLGQELLSRGNDHFRNGEVSQARQDWTNVTIQAPGSTAATEAQRLLKYVDLGGISVGPNGQLNIQTTVLE